MSSKIPLATNTLIANRIATRYGLIITATLKPSFAPVTNDSYIGTRYFAADRMITMMSAGIAHWLTVPMMMPDGSWLSRSARKPMIVTGINVTLPQLIARNWAIEFVAVSFTGLSVCNSSIALSPMGVAALS